MATSKCFKLRNYTIELQDPISDVIGKLKARGKEYYYFRSGHSGMSDVLEDGKTYWAYEAIHFPFPSTFHFVRFDRSGQNPVKLDPFSIPDTSIPVLINMTLVTPPQISSRDDFGTLDFNEPMQFGLDYKRIDPITLRPRDCGGKECRKGVMQANSHAFVFTDGNQLNTATAYYIPMYGKDGDMVYRKTMKVKMQAWVSGIEKGIAVDEINPDETTIGGKDLIVYNDDWDDRVFQRDSCSPEPDSQCDQIPLRS